MLRYEKIRKHSQSTTIEDIELLWFGQELDSSEIVVSGQYKQRQDSISVILNTFNNLCSHLENWVVDRATWQSWSNRIAHFLRWIFRCPTFGRNSPFLLIWSHKKLVHHYGYRSTSAEKTVYNDHIKNKADK